MKTRPDEKPEPLARLRLRVSAAAESILRSGHPWLFADSIQEQNREGRLGELAAVYDRKDRFLAIGFFDPDSPIRLRVLHVGKPQPIDGEWWSARLAMALDRRRGLFDERTNAFRLINGESDGWPGLVLDRYESTLVLKLYSAAWLARLNEVVDTIIRGSTTSGLLAQGRPEADLRVVLRLSRNIQEVARERFSMDDGHVLIGEPIKGPVVFQENGLRFEADVLRGQKTGFFLDQRENRNRVGTLAAGREMLNAFSFSGGFSLYAARGGARSVTDVDISQHALESARRNFALNASNSAVANCRHERIKADAFEWLERNSSRKFGLIVLDPPSLAKRESERAGAISGYASLIAAATELLERGGILVACSCSAHVNAEEFFQTVRSAAARAGRSFQVLTTSKHAPDHPAGFKEAEYLKAIYLGV
jgi:23S rRNA (cytosine1962-C5)-methyltransferase